jgi:hypothetical protein
VEIKYHFVREHVDPVEKNTAELIHVSTHEISADLYTKALISSTFLTSMPRPTRGRSVVAHRVPRSKLLASV